MSIDQSNKNMSLNHAILGFLREEPKTGYDLKTQCFDTSVSHFWPADQAQIYRTLDKLTEQGFIESKLEIQEDRPNRKVYHITEAGRAELDRWLHVPQPLPPYREPYLVQLFFSQEMPNAEIRAQLQTQLDMHRARLAVYNQIEIPDPESLPPFRKLLMVRHMTLDFGKQCEQANIDWLTECIQKLDTLE